MTDSAHAPDHGLRTQGSTTAPTALGSTATKDGYDGQDTLRVIDLTTGPAGGLVTMMLADFGAEVLLINKPTGPDPLAGLAAAPMWQRGKHSLTLDLQTEEGLERLHRLCAGADVLVSNWRPKALERKGLGGDTLATRHPHLVFCHITGYGNVGPLANLPGYEHSVAALTGRMQLFQGLVDRTGPVFSALQVGIHACAQSATTGILAALLKRESTGAGRNVNTSLLQGLLAYEQGAMLGQQFLAAHPDTFVPAPPLEHSPPMPSLYYHPAQAADGRWMQFGNLLPHLFDNFLVTTDLIDIVADPDFNAKQLLLPEEKHEAFRERMLKRIQERTADEWMTDIIDNGSVVATPYQTTQHALQDPDVTENGHAVPTADGGVQLGPVARLTASPAQPGPALVVDKELADRWSASPRPAPTATRSEELPLEGVKVLEIATIIAAPFGASLLADLGAEVIKVEQIGGDPYRGMMLGVGSARVNAGKRSVSLNLKSEQGKKIVLELAKDADVLIHNYRPGVPERLGIGYDTIAAINPNIVYLQSNGYGADGPGSQRPSTHPIPGAAMGGVLYQMGERIPDEVQDIDGLRLWTRRLMRANEVNPDPNTALVVATSAMLGLVARARTGIGQRILMDMFGANAYANHDDFLNYPDKPTRTLPDEGLHGLSPTYRLYQCADEHWVFLAMTGTGEHERFCTALASADLTGPNANVLAANDGATQTALARLFMDNSAAYWEALFVAHDVACLQADATAPNDYWLTDTQSQANKFTGETTHPAWGTYERHGAMVTFDGAEAPFAAPPLAGQHNAEVLAELGYSREQISALLEQNVLWAEGD